MSKTVDFLLCLTYHDFKHKNKNMRMVRRAGEEALCVRGVMVGQESTGGLWLKGRRPPGGWPGAVGAFQHLGERRRRARLPGGDLDPALEWAVLGLSEGAGTLLGRQQAGAWRDSPGLCTSGFAGLPCRYSLRPCT